MPAPEYYTTAQFAEKIGVSHSTVKQYVARGQIQVVKFPRKNLIPAAAAKAFRRGKPGRPLASDDR